MFLDAVLEVDVRLRLVWLTSLHPEVDMPREGLNSTLQCVAVVHIQIVLMTLNVAAVDVNTDVTHDDGSSG